MIASAASIFAKLLLGARPTSEFPVDPIRFADR